MSEHEFLSHTNVSRETLERLRTYAALLEKWNSSINLVAPSTIPDLWSRHFLDSAQIADVAPKAIEKWCDIGTGGGFPGLITAIFAAETDPNRQTICIESDLRKATFLRTVIRETNVRAQVISSRIESALSVGADVLSARALAPLTKLLEFAEMHLTVGGMALFLKGANHQAEIEQALEAWSFTLDIYPSKTNPDAVILKIGEITRV